MFRLILILLIAVGLAPGTWLRNPADRSPGLTVPIAFTPLRIAAPVSGETRLVGAWRIDSPHPHVGGFSALRWQQDNRMLLLSDAGAIVRLSAPGAEVHRTGSRVLPGLAVDGKLVVDTESLTFDEATRRTWISFESANAIVRYDSGMNVERAVRPRAMRKWGANSGPEAMARLADGRFIVLAEGDPWSKGPTPALLYRSDPVDGAPPERFLFDRPDNYRPVDIAQLPDGRVLVLLRQFDLALPPRFTGMLMVADPADIAAGRHWRGRIIARLEPPWPTDNFEGLAIRAQDSGGVDVWIVSDDNQSAFQQTLLLQLHWMPDRP